MESTRKFKRLPPLAAVPFAGFGYAEIESRKQIVSQLRRFVKYCLKEAKSPAAQLILGEWGEGKTEAYGRYVSSAVKPPNRAYLVSASTIAQSLEKVRDDNPLAGLHFLAAVFYAISHEASESPIPPLERFANTAQWVEEILREHSEGRILVFVDEFEELILDVRSLKAILSGLKELINGQYKLIAEHGQYAGLVSFFLSCTPDAYARMQRDPEIAEVFGSWERRVDKAELTSVRRQEAVEFLYGLTRYSYEDNLPTPLPIADSGVFYTLCTIARGNLGALVTLFTKVLNAAAIDDDKMKVVDGSALLDILGRETLSVYGGTTRCVEQSLLEGLQGSLDVDEVKLFRLLLGEQRAFSARELMVRLGLPSTLEVSATIARINQKLGSYTVASPILQLAPLREGLSIEDVWKLLQPEIRDGELRVDGFTEPLEDVAQSLTSLVLREQQLVPRVWFPWDSRMILAFFEGVTPDGARRLQNRMERAVDPGEVWYRISSELTLQLFPTPVPVGLDFIRDRDLRLKMWRNTTAHFSRLFREDMGRAFLALIPCIESWDIEVEFGDGDYLRSDLVTLKDTSQGADISCYCDAHYGDIDGQVIHRICDKLKQLDGAHMAIIVLVGEVTDAARREARARDMDSRLLFVPLHTTTAKRLLIAYECNRSYHDALDDKLFVEAVGNLYKTELEFSDRVKHWLEKGAEAGLVLHDLYKATARGERDLADSLKFYINLLGEPRTPEEVFEANQRLRSFVPFGVRAGFIPDIESAERLVRYTDDLARNGFIQWESDRTVRVAQTSVERRFVQMLETAGHVASAKAAARFVNSAKARNIFEDVYVNILKHKGRVGEASGLLSVVTVQQALARAADAKNEYQELMQSYAGRPDWRAFGHVFVTKQRAKLFISIGDLQAYLDDTYEGIERAATEAQQDIVLQKTALLTALADHLRRLLLPKVDYSMLEGRRVAEDTRAHIEDYLSRMSDARDEYCQRLGMADSRVQLREANQLAADKRMLDSMCSTPITEQDIQPDEADDEAFDHKGWGLEGRGFNVALFRLRGLSKSVRGRTAQYDRGLAEVTEALRALQQVGHRTRSRLLTMAVPAECSLASLIHASLVTYVNGLLALRGAQPRGGTGAASSVLTLAKMAEDLRALCVPLEECYRLVDGAINSLERLLDAEEKLKSADERCVEAEKALEGKLDVPPAEERSRELSGKRGEVLRAYERYRGQVEQLVAAPPPRAEVVADFEARVRAQIVALDAVLAGLENIWTEYADGCVHFAGSVRQMLRLGKRQDPMLESDPVEARCSELADAVSAEEWPSQPLTAYEALKAEIRSATFGLLEKTLDRLQGQVLLAVVDRRDRSEAGWLPLAGIVPGVAKETANSEPQVREALRALVAKGYLADGVSIPV